MSDPTLLPEPCERCHAKGAVYGHHCDGCYRLNLQVLARVLKERAKSANMRAKARRGLQ